MPTKAALSYRRPCSYDEATELLWSLGDHCAVQTIGSSAAGKSIYALSVGGTSAPCPAVVYCGTDLFSATLLLQFAFALPELLSQNATLHRIHLPTLLAHRRLCLCPFLCPDNHPDGSSDVQPGGSSDAPPDAMEDDPAVSLTNGLGVFLPDCFTASPIPVPEKAPEVLALRQYLSYTEPALLCVLQKGTAARLYPARPKAPTDHLLSRTLHAEVGKESTEDAPAFLSIPFWYGAETGHMAYGVTVTEGCMSHMPAFFCTAPLLIG